MHRLRIAFVLAAAGVCLVSLAARAPLIDPDEGLHAAIAQEMLLRHDYVTPTFLGEPFLDKPILFFWAEAASLNTFGMNETAVRIPPLLFGLAGACAVVLLGAALFDQRAGYAAGIAYATMILPVGVSEVAVHDVALIPFLLVACYGIWRLWKNDHLLLWSAVVGASIGLSILTKGLVGAAFAGLFGAVLAAHDRRTLPRLAVAALICGTIAAAVAAPWYIAMERAHPGYLHYYFVERHVQGYFTATQRHAGRAWWYYVPIVAGGALPWLPVAFSRSAPATSRQPQRLVWIWFIAGIVFLSAGESKLATYVLPAFPALALVMGERLTSGHGTRGATYVTFVVACAAIPIIGATAVVWRFSVDVVALEAKAAVAASLILAIAFRERTAADDRRIATMAAMAFVSLAAVVLLALPRAARWMSARDLAAILNGRPSLPPRVLVLDERIGSVIFYLSPRLRREATTSRFEDAALADVFARLGVEQGDALLAVRADQLPRVQKLFPAPLTPDAQSGVYRVFSIARLRR
jgi:4-amino-4-deoxy-L-arabinose transferase-like glycosyltransferase